MKQLPLQLKIGIAVTVLLLLIALFPGLFTRANPYATETLRYQTDGAGSFVMQRAPFPRSGTFPWGPTKWADSSGPSWSMAPG